MLEIQKDINPVQFEGIILVLSGIPIKRSLASTLRRKLKNLAESPKVLLLLGESSSSSSITSRTEPEAESEAKAEAEAEAEAEVAAVPRSSSQGTTGLYLESFDICQEIKWNSSWSSSSSSRRRRRAS
ncbi:hypothetical protein M0804_009873 [Polistes exclamans]|nr:hypothetical protein M0804_009873 [Polistes exclamans]